MALITKIVCAVQYSHAICTEGMTELTSEIDEWKTELEERMTKTEHEVASVQTQMSQLKLDVDESLTQTTQQLNSRVADLERKVDVAASMPPTAPPSNTASASPSAPPPLTSSPLPADVSAQIQALRTQVDQALTRTVMAAAQRQAMKTLMQQTSQNATVPQFYVLVPKPLPPPDLKLRNSIKIWLGWSVYPQVASYLVKRAIGPNATEQEIIPTLHRMEREGLVKRVVEPSISTVKWLLSSCEADYRDLMQLESSRSQSLSEKNNKNE